MTIGGASTFGLLTELGVSIGSTAPVNLLTQGAVAGGQTLVITIGANPATTITFGTGGGQVSTMGELATALLGLAGGTAALNTSNGNLSITAASITDTVAIGGTATPLNFGMHTVNGYPSNGTVIANDVTAFVDCSIGGGAVTCYDESGSPVNIQIRWAKLDSSVYGGTDTWNMFYQVNPNATGTAVAWQNAGVDYNFLPNGQMSPAITTINGEACGIGGWCPAGESMRIYGPNGAGSAATAPTVRRAGAGQFAVDHQDSTRAASGGTLRAIGGIDTLLALQGIGDATERRRQAVKRGRVALDVLEELKVGMLGGTLSPTVMTRLQAAAGLLRDETGESGLDSVLAEIGLRVEVELAKAGA